MTYYDRFTGKPVDRLSDFLPSTLPGFCEEWHPETHLIKNCHQCGAPVCCPKCCDGVEPSNDTQAAAGGLCQIALEC